MEGPADRLFDLAFAPYRPLRPTAGKDPGVSLLWAALAAAGAQERWEAPLRALQRGIGRGRTIWGARRRGGRSAWHLRLDNHGRERLLDALRREFAPWLTIAPGVEDDGDYEILGVDLDLDRESARDEVAAVDLHRRGASPQEREIWRLDAGGRRRVAGLLIAEAKREIAIALPQIKASRAVDLAGDRRLLGRVLIPELFACRHLHVVRRVDDHAGDADADALVYSGINVEQLAWFLGRFGYPEALREHVQAGRDGLDHLLFDVEVAFRQEGAAIVYPETTFYGAL